MKPKSIILYDHEIRAALENRLGLIVRPVARPPEYYGYQKCPFGEPGQALWVQETWYPWFGYEIIYKATQISGDWLNVDSIAWKPSIHMKRECSRLTLELVSVEWKLLQKITGEEAIACGWETTDLFPLINTDDKAIGWFKVMWARRFGKKHPWASNHWAWFGKVRRV